MKIDYLQGFMLINDKVAVKQITKLKLLVDKNRKQEDKQFAAILKKLKIAPHSEQDYILFDYIFNDYDLQNSGPKASKKRAND